MPVAEIFLAAFMKVLFDRLPSRQLLEFASRRGISPRLKKLEAELKIINGVITLVENMVFLGTEVDEWLEKVRHWAYAADDFLDGIKVRAMLDEEEAARRNHTCGSVSVSSCFCENIILLPKSVVDWQRSQIIKLALSSPSAQDNELREIYSSDMPRFGPFYGGDEMVVWTWKEDAWEHVLMEFPGVDADTTTKAYLSAVKRIEKQARETYAVAAGDHEAECLLNGPRFRRMMVKDGCFILQLVLFSLGGHLGYDPNHPIFGETRNTRHVRLHALFFVGNQIPLVVLHGLMKQPFFKRVLVGQKWKSPPDLLGRTLFELLVRPFLEPGWSETMKGLFWAFCRTDGGATSLHRLEPSDILNGLHLLVVGPGSDVANEDEDGDLSGDEEDGGVPNVGRWSKSHCATELAQMGIHFRNAGEVGTGGIRFKETMFCAVLFLPTLQVDADAELVFRYLRNYEVSQQLGRSKREVCAYLQFMSELIQTPDDARVLAAKGIVRAAPKEKEKLAAILSRVAGGETNQKLRLVRLQIHDYKKLPWEKIRNFLSLVLLLLTVVQTVYTVMAYYK